MAYWHSDHDHRSGNLSQMLKDVTLGVDRMKAEMLALYRTLPYEFSDIYRTLFTQLACGPLPLAFNCAAGKDRTGVAAAMLLDALGVAWSCILSDYMLSADSSADVMRIFGWSDRRLNSGRYSPTAATTLFGVKPSYLEAMKDSVVARSGSIHQFLVKDLRLGADIVKTLRQRLLVPTSRSPAE